MIWKSKPALVVGLCLINSAIVYHFARDKFYFPNWFSLENNTITFESVENKVVEFFDLMKSEFHDSQGDELQEIPRDDEHTFVDLPAVGSGCADKRKTPKAKRIYTWTDSEGIRHLSDTPRAFNSSLNVSFVAEIPPESISVNFSGLEGYFAIRPLIMARVTKSLELYKSVVPDFLIKPVIVNLKLFWSESEFLSYKERVAPQLNYAQGFYRSAVNESVVWVKSEEQGVRTSVHEVMHSINRHWIGNMSKWLNEGVAELAEMQSYQPTDLKRAIRPKELLPLKTLFETASENWIKTRAQAEYYTAFALVAYLYSQERDVLSRLLLADADNGCELLSVRDIERITGESTERLNQKLLSWTNV